MTSLRHVHRSAADALRALWPGRRRLCIDVGARNGFSLWQRFGLGRRNVVIHAFEPNPVSMAEIAPYADRFPGLRLHPMAVSLENGKSRFHVTRNPECATLLETRPEVVQQNAEIPAGSLDVLEVIEVETIRLDTFLEREGIERVDLLKIDAEGHDLDVVRSAGDAIRRVVKLRMEVQSGPTMYVGDSREQEAVAYLAQHGFALTKKYTHPHGWAHDLTFRNRALA